MEQGNNIPTNNEEKKVDLLEYVFVVMKWRGFILKCVIGVTLVAAILSFLLPLWYKATVSILPPKDTGLLSSLGGLGASGSVGSVLRNIPLVGRGTFGINLGAYNYLAILKSRTAMEAVVQKFDLIRIYEVSENSMEKAVKELESNTKFEIQNEDYITIDVWDKDRQRSADIANYFVEVLNEVSNRLGTQEARNNRDFIERRVEKGRLDLHAAEEFLKVYQEQSGILISPDKEGIAPVAELYAMKARKEVEIGILERTVSKDNPVLQQLKIELSEIGKRVSQIPEAGIGTLRLYREVAIQQKILEFLIPIFEQAKVDEHKDIPVILVLDKAVPPEKKDRPKRMLITLISFVSAFFISVFVALLFESIRARKQDPRWSAKLQEFDLTDFSFRKMFQRSRVND